MNETETKSVPRVFLVDDDRTVINTLSHLLQSAGFEVFPYRSAREFIADYRPLAPACVILALRLPEISGLEVQQWIAQTPEPLPVIFISRYTDVPATVRAMKAGAVDFLPKPVDPQQLLNAVNDALDRQRQKIAERAEIAAVEERMATLTPREREVLMHVVSGQLNKQIAGDLGTVEKTVKVHRARVMRKMQAHSLAELVRMIARIDRDMGLSTQPRAQASVLAYGAAVIERPQTQFPVGCTKTSSRLS
jgi:FixJ family two-component response regulator